MAVRIRLTRVGATKRPAYRVIAIDRRRSRDGRALEILGFYDPLTEPATVQLETEKISAWIGKGAQPSDMVVRLMRQAEKAAAAPTPAEKPKRPARPKAAAPKAASKSSPKQTAAAPEPDATEPVAVAASAKADTASDESGSADALATDAAAAQADAPAETPETPEGAEPAPDAKSEERDA